MCVVVNILKSNWLELGLELEQRFEFHLKLKKSYVVVVQESLWDGLKSQVWQFGLQSKLKNLYGTQPQFENTICLK